MSSGLDARLPTYPMIPHIRSLLHSNPVFRPEFRPRKPPIKRRKPGVFLAELPSDESDDASTGLIGQLGIFGLGENPDHWFSAGRADEHAALSVPRLVEPLDLLEHGRSELFAPDAHVLFRLRPPGHHRGRLTQLAALQRTAQEQA